MTAAVAKVQSSHGGKTAAGGKPKGKGHWVTVSYPNGGYHHIFVPGPDGASGPHGAKLMHGRKVPKGGKPPEGHHVATPTGLKAHGGDAGPKAKTAGRKVGKAEHNVADRHESKVATAIGGRKVGNEEGNRLHRPPHDVERKRPGGGTDYVEVKSITKSSKQRISIHDDALVRKAQHMGGAPAGSVYHTVVGDYRDTYMGGKFAKHYSGNNLYYKRGAGAYSLSQMHPVRDEAELKRLHDMADHELPEKARGTLPEVDENLLAKAEKVHANRLVRAARVRAKKRVRRTGEAA